MVYRDNLQEEERRVQQPRPTPKRKPIVPSKINKVRSFISRIGNRPISIKGASVPKSWLVTADKTIGKAKSIVDQTPGKILQSISARDRGPVKWRKDDLYVPKDVEVKGGTVITPIGRGLSVVSCLLYTSPSPRD